MLTSQRGKDMKKISNQMFFVKKTQGIVDSTEDLIKKYGQRVVAMSSGGISSLTVTVAGSSNNPLHNRPRCLNEGRSHGGKYVLCANCFNPPSIHAAAVLTEWFLVSKRPVSFCGRAEVAIRRGGYTPYYIIRTRISNMVSCEFPGIEPFCHMQDCFLPDLSRVVGCICRLFKTVFCFLHRIISLWLGLSSQPV